jgi:hypothetical protein
MKSAVFLFLAIFFLFGIVGGIEHRAELDRAAAPIVLAAVPQ